MQEQVEHFADIFRRQVYGPSISQDVVDSAVRITAVHNRKVRACASLTMLVRY
jgi:hypothetical protein